MSDLRGLLTLMRRLRDPDRGCPWDRAQSWHSIVPHTLEEAYEVADVIERGALEALPDELGDLLFQIVFYCQFGREEGRFGIDEVIAALEDKLVRRHPHVFDDAEHDSAAAVASAWETRKAHERRARRATSELDDVPLALPALTRARKVQRRAARVGFDWPQAAPVWTKLAEEIEELEAAAAGHGDVGEELGDVLFTVVNLARHLEVDAEASLRAATRKFESRFRAVEAELAASGRRMDDCDAAELERLWQLVKRRQDEKKAGA